MARSGSSRRWKHFAPKKRSSLRHTPRAALKMRSSWCCGKTPSCGERSPLTSRFPRTGTSTNCCCQICWERTRTWSAATLKTKPNGRCFSQQFQNWDRGNRRSCRCGSGSAAARNALRKRSPKPLAFPSPTSPDWKRRSFASSEKTGGGRPAPHPHRQQITRAAGHFALRLF